MLLKHGIKNDASNIYREIVDVEKFFKDIALGEAGTGEGNHLSAVSAAHRIYTNSIAVLPFMVKQKKGDERLDVAHKLEPILKNRGNRHMTAYMVKKAIMSQAFWHGIGFAYIQRENGVITEIIPLPSKGYSRYIDYNTGSVWYSFSVDTENPERPKLQRKFMESELLIHYFESYDGIRGKGVLELAKESIKTDSAAQTYGQKFFTNGARVSGILEVDGELDTDARRLVREDFERVASGMDNAFKVAVLDLGTKYTQLGISQRDSQFIEGRNFSVEEISRFTGIPKYMLQVGKESYQSNEQQQLDFVKNTLIAPVTQIEQEWAYKLLSAKEIEDGYYLKLNVMALLRGDDKSRSEYYQKMVSLGIYNQDECRALEDVGPLPNGEGKSYWMSKNYDTIQNITKGFTK